MGRLPFVALACLAASAGTASAEADGPDFFQLRAGAAVLRHEPVADSPAVMTIPAGATCLRNFGCKGGLSMAEFATLAPDERAKREAASPRWCKVEIAGRFGWVEGRELAEGPCRSPRASAPSFDCRKPRNSSAEELVCRDPELAALDRRMAVVYAAALKKAASEKPPLLKALQRGWVKGRDDCWKEADRRACVKDRYVRWSAELEAKYRLVPARGPAYFTCENNRANELVVTRFTTDPPTLIAERGDESSLMFRDIPPRGGAVSWSGRNESIVEEANGTMRVVWGYQATPITCVASN